jgi:hypothetical protein
VNLVLEGQNRNILSENLQKRDIASENAVLSFRQSYTSPKNVSMSLPIIFATTDLSILVV